jgi:lactobin A/cerein 7B family class IIb bacteriocin
MRELNKQELEEVSGGFNPLLGGFLGGMTYLAGNTMTGQDITAAGFSSAVVFGAVTSDFSVLGGALSGAANIARAAHAASMGTLAGSATYGVVSSIGGGTNMRTGSHIMEKYK